MKKIYIAGPYNDNNVLGVLRNIGRGEYWAAELFKDGFAPFCPWFDKAFVISNFFEEFTVEQFRAYSMEWLRVSDAVFVVPDYPGMKKSIDSDGTFEEIKEAERLGIPVFYGYKELIDWKNKKLI